MRGSIRSRPISNSWSIASSWSGHPIPSSTRSTPCSVGSAAGARCRSRATIIMTIRRRGSIRWNSRQRKSHQESRFPVAARSPNKLKRKQPDDLTWGGPWDPPVLSATAATGGSARDLTPWRGRGDAAAARAGKLRHLILIRILQNRPKVRTSRKASEWPRGMDQSRVYHTPVQEYLINISTIYWLQYDVAWIDSTQ